MNLRVRRIEAPGVPGGYAFALCDESGELLPNQRRCIFDCGLAAASVTVTLDLDGKTVSLEE